MYPNMDDLLKKLAETQKELVAQISESPAEVVSRKSSLTRMANCASARRWSTRMP